MARNVRYSNGNARRKLRLWLRSQERPCWICRAFGKSGAIDYSLPAGHPFAFEVDELVPVSLGGSPLDHGNVDAAHRCCNQWRSNKTVDEVLEIASSMRRDKHAVVEVDDSETDGPPLVETVEGTTSREW